MHFDEVTSTNEELKRIITQGQAKEGLVVSTEYQTSGRGQIGNSWESNDGENLLLSVYLEPTFLSPADFFLLNMSVCLAVVESLNEIHNGFQIKWPNDVLFDGKKIGGILIETTISGTRVQSAIIGIGLNINQRTFLSNGHFKPSSLRNVLGQIVDRDYVKRILLNCLESRYLNLRADNTGHEIRQHYFDMLFGFSTPVLAGVRGQRKYVQIQDVCADGRLIVLHEGKQESFLFKEISFYP